MTPTEKVQAIVAILEDMKSESVETLDVRDKTSIADFFIVCSGTSDRHTDSIADKVLEKMREQKQKPFRSEGVRSGWILLDYGDVVVHVMREEQRQFFDLETLWKTMKPNPDLLGTPAA